MKKTVFNVVACLALTSFVASAQNNAGCGVYQMQQHHIKTLPGYKEKLDALKISSQVEYQQFLQQKTLNRSVTSLPTYTIPVVFHILHTGGSENIPDADCIAALAQVNKDYARLSPDTISIDPLFEPLYVNSKIQFALAKKDPNGNCTTGIVHHYDENTNWTRDIYNYVYSNGRSGTWIPSKYLNIYIVKDIPSDGSAGTVLGYTYLPGSTPAGSIGADAIVYRYDNLLGLAARSLSHEIGHWLGLAHTFGDSNNAGINCSNSDDGITDTPKTTGFFSTCPSIAQRSDSCSPGMRPNVENIMDYSACPKMFTQGQVDRMRSVLESGTAGRNHLWITNNLDSTGVINNAVTACAPIADFVANKVDLCTGQSVTFNSTSYNSTPTNYVWTFEGGTPATSTLASQTVTYATPGVYSVSLVVSNANGTNTKATADYIHAFWNSEPIPYPYAEDFETGTLRDGWYADNKDFNTIQWEVASYGSQSSQKSFFLNNSSGYYEGNVDALVTPKFNLRGASNVSISFDYSGSRSPGIIGSNSSLRFQYSLDCGGSWTNVITGLPNDSIIAKNTGGVLSGPYVPTSPTKWVTKTYPSNILGSVFNNRQDVQFRFLFTNSYSGLKNIYIDNFNISATVGLSELESAIGLSLYPNPTNTSSTLEFTTPLTTIAQLTVCDVTGRIVETKNIKSTASETVKYTVNQGSNLNAGIYFVTLTINNQNVTKKLIIQ